MLAGGRSGLPIAGNYGGDIRFFIQIVLMEVSRSQDWFHAFRGGSRVDMKPRQLRQRAQCLIQFYEFTEYIHQKKNHEASSWMRRR